MDGLIRTGKDTIKNNEVVFRNFDKKRLTDFKKSLTNLKIPTKKQDELVSAVTNSKKAFNRLQTDLLQGGNLTTTNKDELLDFFSQRLNSTLSNDYKIFQNNKVFKTTNYIPTDEKRHAVAQYL